MWAAVAIPFAFFRHVSAKRERLLCMLYVLCSSLKFISFLIAIKREILSFIVVGWICSFSLLPSSLSPLDSFFFIVSRTYHVKRVFGRALKGLRIHPSAPNENWCSLAICNDPAKAFRLWCSMKFKFKLKPSSKYLNGICKTRTAIREKGCNVWLVMDMLKTFKTSILNEYFQLTTFVQWIVCWTVFRFWFYIYWGKWFWCCCRLFEMNLFRLLNLVFGHIIWFETTFVDSWQRWNSQ